MEENKSKVYFRCAQMPIITKKISSGNSRRYAGDDNYDFVERVAFTYDRAPMCANNAYDTWCIAEAVLVHPEKCLDDSNTKMIAFISSIPKPGNENFATNMTERDLTDPEDLELIYGMSGSDLNKEEPDLYAIYLTGPRKYIRRVRVTRKGVKLPIPLSVVNTSGITPEGGCLDLKLPVKDKMAFDDHLNEIDIVEDLSSAGNAAIIIFHDIKYAVAYLMAYANADVKAGENSWVAKWSDTVSKHVAERRAEDEKKRKANEEYNKFVKLLPPAPGYIPPKKKFNWKRMVTIPAGLAIGFLLGELWMLCH
jgi:hypothetical protein